MFVSKDIPCAIRAVALKIEADGDTEKRVAHASIQVEPFTPALAGELGCDVYDHLFQPDPHDPERPMPKPEIAEVGFLIRCGLQRIEAKAHPDLKVEAELRNVRIARVRVTRPDPDRPRLSLGFVLSIELTSRTVMAWVVDAFARVNYLTFTREQLDLIDDDREAAERRLQEAGASVQVAGEWKPVTSKNVADALDGGKARRLREIAEDFKAAQPDGMSVTMSHAGESVTISSEAVARAKKTVAARRDRNARQARTARR